jgi:molybdopterin-guanine dinucleotide biosynthesis protein MobB
MKAIAVVGTKKTGKTTVVTALVRSLSRYGRVGTIKNMAGHSIDRGDTGRHFQAGAEVVIGLGEGQLRLKRGGSIETALAELQEEGMDFAVVEGFKHSHLPKIVMGEADVPDVLRRMSISELDEGLLEELTRLVQGLQDYQAGKDCSPGRMDS